MAVVVLCALTWTLLLLCVISARPGEAEEAVQKPFNLTVYSYNMNTTLHWNYNKKEITPYFSVEILNKVTLNWMAIETCQNISFHYCDLSHKITDPLKFYKVRVKASVGSNTSNASNIEFILSDIGIIGPPELDIYIEEKIIFIEIIHPKMPSVPEIKEHIETGALNYEIYHGNYTLKATECDSSVCILEYPISDNGAYCFYAQGESNSFLGMTMEKSGEICVHVDEDIPSNKIIIVIGVLFGVLAIFGISCFIITRWTNARALMPQSLSSVVRNIVSYVQMPSQQTTRYDNVSTTPIESPDEEKSHQGKKVNMDIAESADSASKESSDPGYQGSLTENEQKTQERGDEQSNSSSYFHAESSNGDINRDNPEPEKEEKMPEPEPEPPKDVRPLSNSFGYDKPHFPKELV